MLINIRTRASNIRLNGTHFVCSVDEVESGEQSYGCATRNVYVVYLFNSTERRSVDISHDDQAVNISCFANTSQPCHYRWRVTSTSTKNLIEILGQTIDLLKQDFRDMRCLAECRIRNVLCTVEPMFLEFNRMEAGSWRLLDLPLVPTLLVNVIVIVVIVIIWKFINVSKMFNTFRHLIFMRKIQIEEISEELQPFGDHQEFSDTDIPQDKTQTLVKNLKPEKLIECLMSNGALTVEEYNMLLQEHQNQESFLKILTQLINTKSKFNSLLAMVIEFDPNFHCVGSTLTDFVKQNMSKLIECLDVDNGLADCLFSRDVLTSEQYEKLTNKSWWSSFQEQNLELLSSMLPARLESEHMCKMLLAALIETDQRHIFNFISNSLSEAEFNENSDCRILTADELNRIDRNLFHLINLIEPSPTFLDSLLREGCITQRHRERIDAQQTPSAKNKELLSIVRRRSYGDFKTFKRIMQTTQRNGIIILRLLEQESDHVISAHCEINIEPEATMSLEHVTELETRISSHLTDPTIRSQSLTQEASQPIERTA